MKIALGLANNPAIIAAAAGELAAGAPEPAAEQGTSSMTQALGTIEVVSKSLQEIAALAKRSVDSAVEGANAVKSVVEGINTIAQSSEKIGGNGNGHDIGAGAGGNGSKTPVALPA